VSKKLEHQNLNQKTKWQKEESSSEEESEEDEEGNCFEYLQILIINLLLLRRSRIAGRTWNIQKTWWQRQVRKGDERKARQINVSNV
jgi:hypothetical protein